MESLQPESLLDPEPTPEKRSGWRRLLVDLIETVIIAAVLFLGINAISARIRVDSFSRRDAKSFNTYDGRALIKTGKVTVSTAGQLARMVLVSIIEN